jgi:hypothetical protein
VLSFLRRHEDERILVCVNFSSRSANADLPSGRRWSVLLSTRCQDRSPAEGTIRLGPEEAVILI